MSYETGVRWKWIPFVVLGFVLLSWIVFEALDLIDFEGVVTWVRGIDPVWAAVAGITGAACVGAGLRFVPAGDFLLPTLVGLSVAAATVILLRYGAAQEPEHAPVAPAPPAAKPEPTRSPISRRLSGIRRRLKPTNRDGR